MTLTNKQTRLLSDLDDRLSMIDNARLDALSDKLQADHDHERTDTPSKDSCTTELSASQAEILSELNDHLSTTDTPRLDAMSDRLQADHDCELINGSSIE